VGVEQRKAVISRRRLAWRRCLGLVLLATGIVSGTIVALSFATKSISWPVAYGTTKGRLLIDRGTIFPVWYPVGTPRLKYALVWSPGVGPPPNFRLPVWPLPPLLIASGAIVQPRRERRPKEDRPILGRRTRAAGQMLVATGLATSTVVALSFVMYIHGTRGLFSPSILEWGVGHGAGAIGVSNTREWERRNEILQVSGPFIVKYFSRPGRSILWFPVWPLPLACLLAGAWTWRRGERSGRLSEQGICSRCGYPLPSTESRTCPECGHTGGHSQAAPVPPESSTSITGDA
jgi:hypothetical protein